MFEVSAPGKLLLSGEWSVLEVGTPCIVAAVNKRVKVQIQESNRITIFAPDLGLEKIEANFDEKNLEWEKKLSEEEEKKLIMSKNSIEITLRYLQDKGIKSPNFYITTSSEESQVKLSDGSIKKIGFGASASVCVAIIGAILKMNGFNLNEKKTKDLVYKLAAIAHYFAQGKIGSAFDIAAATYGGVIVYKRFDPEWLVAEIEKEKIEKIVENEWKGFSVEPLSLPETLQLCVAWTGFSASTKELILKLNGFKEKEKQHYWKIISSIKQITEELIKAIKANDKKKILELIEANRVQLKELSDASGSNLETKELALLAQVAKQNGGAGKFSGAGGGDCGIAVCFDPRTAEKINNTWKEKGLWPLDVKIAVHGLQ